MDIPTNSHLEEIEDTLKDRLETWRPVVGYEGRYEVSDEGRVRSLIYPKAKGIPIVMRQQKDRLGYWRMVLGSKKANVRVHALVAEAFIGPRPEGMDINHKNGVKSDNRLDNLEYCTESENTKHSFQNGLQVAAFGESHYRTKLKKEDVANIIRMVNEGKLSQAKIAAIFGLKQQAISKIKLGERWSKAMKEVES